MYRLFAESDTRHTIRHRDGELAQGGTRRRHGRARNRRRCSGRKRSRDPDQPDPYSNPASQHRTQVEPDSFGYGNTVVATFQTGRFNVGGGSSNIGWATTTNAGRTWTTGMLPGTTIYQGGPWSRISDPAVAYDPLHQVWMISTLDLRNGPRRRSGAERNPHEPLDGRRAHVAEPRRDVARPGHFYDKNWIACDTWLQSPHYGNCYTEWDDNGPGTASR